MPLLFKRKSDDCKGSSQLCQTPENTTNTLAICLAVIIPVVVVACVIAFFMWKNYRKNKKEILEDNDPDFNADNIMLPEYDYDNQINPNSINMRGPKIAGFSMAAASTDSFGNPFNERNLDPSLAPVRPQLHYQRSNPLALPFGNSKEELDRYSKDLGIDFHDFNYPVKKMNTPSAPPSASGSRVNTQPNSRRTSISNLHQTTYANGNTSQLAIPRSEVPMTSPLRKNAAPPNVQKNESEEESDDDTDDSDNDSENDSEDDSDSDSENDSEDDSEDDSDSDSSDASSGNSMSHEQTDHNASQSENPFVANTTSTSPLSSTNDAFKRTNQTFSATNVDDADTIVKQGQLQAQPHERAQVPPTPTDIPLTEEEEEQLNRMKSVYQVYFSRNGSKYVKRDGNEEDNEEDMDKEYIGIHARNNSTYPQESVNVNSVPPLPIEQLEAVINKDTNTNANANANANANTLQVPGAADDQTPDDYRQSVSSSVYMPVNESLTTANPTKAGYYAHQQFGNMVPNSQEQYAYQQGYPQGYQQGYPQEYPQGYYQPDQYAYQQQQQQQQQHHQQQGYYPQQYAYAANQRVQPYANVNGIAPPAKRLQELEKLPLPHQLNKRTSTLESFTTFTSESHKNPVTHPAMPIDHKFDPIDHVNWAQSQQPLPNQGTTAATAAPSPSQIRNSIVMFNPVGLSQNTTFVSKGTAKERVREMNKLANNGNNTIPEGFTPPASPALQGPLYGFYENSVERPHGAENLIPRSGSQADLRRQMENANV